MDARVPASVRKPRCHQLTSHATSGVASKRVAARYDVTAVITRTTTILGFETSR